MFTNIFFKSLSALVTTIFGLSPIVQMFNMDLTKPEPIIKQNQGVQRFASCSILKEQIKKAEDERIFSKMDMIPMPMAMESQGSANDLPAINARDYSETNVQVAGVDEADILKIDGTYVYHLSKNRIMISQILPTESSRLVGQIDMDKDITANDFYIDGDRLMIMGQKYQDYSYPMPLIDGIAREIVSYPYRESITISQIWDIENKFNPKKIRTVEFDGSLSSSRMIEGNVYLIMNSWSKWRSFNIMPTEKELVPMYRDSVMNSDFEPMVKCGNVGYFDPEPSREYLIVASVPMHGAGQVQREVILGSSETTYASLENLYVAKQDWMARSLHNSLVSEGREQTNIYKFKLNAGRIEFIKQGFVPGHLLNQFSLDEYNNYLRVATTIGQVWRTSANSTNNIFILDSELNLTGSIEGIAPGETIYSMRFMGDKGYMVTFKKIDPFFVLDLKDPKNPSILGKLKIPGYSDYLHPMDENHIIGVGKDTVEASENIWGRRQDFAWYQGMKMAIFDVTDVANPKELWKTEIGDRGTESEALSNHKAFMYSPSKQLLALPIRVAELDESVKKDPYREGNEYGDFTFQGAYVYRLTLEKGFELLGRITHHTDNQSTLKSGWYYGNYDEDINRVAYMDNTFLTLSNSGIQMHHLYDLVKQGEIDYPDINEPGYRDSFYE